jgi:hypothetical protein
VIRKVASVLLRRLALTCLRGAIVLDADEPTAAEPVEDELPEVDLPLGGGPMTAEARKLVVVKTPEPEPKKPEPLPGSVEARFAKARPDW